MDDRDLRAYRILRKFKLVTLVNALLIFKDSGFKGIKNKLKEKHHKEEKIKISNLSFEPFKINLVFQNEKLYNKYKEIFPKNFKYNIYILSKNKKGKKYINTEEFNFCFKFRSFIYITTKNKIKSNYEKCFILKDDIDFEEKLKKLLSESTLAQLIANFESKNYITAKCSTFFDYNGTNYYSGGAERYLVDLFEVSKELNKNFVIYQNANKNFIRKYRNITVVGLSNNETEINYSTTFFKSQMETYLNKTNGKSILHIFSAFQECYPIKCSPSIGISHGIYWDNPTNVATNGLDFWVNKKIIIDSALLCDKMISVDTNTANWFQTIDYKLGNQKINVITNYVDTKEFKKDGYYKKKGKIVITYPRRLYEPRGMYLLLSIVDDLFKKYDNIEVHFVGKGFDEDVNKIKEKMKKYKDRLFCYSMEPERMNEVYKMSDISLIPTLYSEGTSLSCLEAMSTENIVVTTRIGGLTDLVINGLNGYQIEPNKEALLKQLEYIIDNFDKQKEIRRNALMTAKAFNKELWKNKWKEVIKEFKLADHPYNNIGLVEFYFKDITKINKNSWEIITKEIMNNNLVYLRSEKKVKKDNISFGLLQLVDYNDLIESEPLRIYVEDGIKINRNGNIIKM